MHLCLIYIIFLGRAHIHQGHHSLVVFQLLYYLWIFSCPSSSIPTPEITYLITYLLNGLEFRALQTTTNQTNLTYLSDPPKLHTHLTYYPPT